ncbi:MAG TPA: hypothetical protein VGU63_06885 [Candidatus Acidoferrales bacterium]|nr:hypothetical protein [Candidatus Acidoferrales bacterium]
MRERIAPILEAALCVWLFWYIATQPQRSKLPVVLALVMLVIFLRDGSRLWGWSIRMSPEEFRVRRYFRWTAVPWAQIRGVELTGARSRNNEGVALTLAPEGQLQLGAFVYPFARALRDHLREEIAKRRGQST